jgi:hypothetical protein
MSPCHASQDGTLIVCIPRGRHIDTKERWPKRWCFHCRTRQCFQVWLFVDDSPWYEPVPYAYCPNCKAHDSDLFPGHERTWEDE